MSFGDENRGIAAFLEKGTRNKNNASWIVRECKILPYGENAGGS